MLVASVPSSWAGGRCGKVSDWIPSSQRPREARLEMETQDPHVGPAGSRHVSLPAASQVQAEGGSGSIFSSHGCRQYLEVGQPAGLPGRPKGTAIPRRRSTALRLKRMLCVLCSRIFSPHVP